MQSFFLLTRRQILFENSQRNLTSRSYTFVEGIEQFGVPNSSDSIQVRPFKGRERSIWTFEAIFIRRPKCPYTVHVKTIASGQNHLHLIEVQSRGNH